MSFADHFSDKSEDYAAFRPVYPDGVFAFLAEVAPGRDRAWDCATGTGQAAQGLAKHFAAVDATDASAQQVRNAFRVPNVTYSVQPAEGTTFADRAFDAICVAQAVHWFDLDRFYEEVARVLRPRGVIALLGYDWARVSPEVDRQLHERLLTQILPFWPPQVKYLQRGYRDLPFPFARIEAPTFRIEMSWTAEQYLAYVETWSATRAYIAKHGRGILDNTLQGLRATWRGEGARTVTMPLHVRIGRLG